MKRQKRQDDLTPEEKAYLEGKPCPEGGNWWAWDALRENIDGRADALRERVKAKDQVRAKCP